MSQNIKKNVVVIFLARVLSILKKLLHIARNKIKKELKIFSLHLHKDAGV